MKVKKDSGDGPNNFTEDVGITDIIMRKNSGEQTGHDTEFMIFINKYHIGDRTAKPYYP